MQIFTPCASPNPLQTQRAPRSSKNDFVRRVQIALKARLGYRVSQFNNNSSNTSTIRHSVDAELVLPERHHFTVRESFGRVEDEVDQAVVFRGERLMRREGLPVVMSGTERGRKMYRGSAAESNLGDDVGDIEPSEEELGSDKEDDRSSLDYSTSGSSSSPRSSSNHSFHSTMSSVCLPSSPIPSSSPTSPTSPPCPHSHMAFFSLTRTADGTSLTADMHALAKFFDGQWDLVYCVEEFERLEWQVGRRETSVDLVDEINGYFE